MRGGNRAVDDRLQTPILAPGSVSTFGGNIDFKSLEIRFQCLCFFESAGCRRGSCAGADLVEMDHSTFPIHRVALDRSATEWGVCDYG